MKKIAALIQSTVQKITQKQGVFLLGCEDRGEERSDLPMLHPRGFVSMPKKNEHTWVLRIGKFRVALSVMQRVDLKLKESEVCVIRDDNNYLHFKEDGTIKIKVGGQNFLKQLDATLTSIKNLQVTTSLGPMGIAPNSLPLIQSELEKLKTLCDLQ